MSYPQNIYEVVNAAAKGYENTYGEKHEAPYITIAKFAGLGGIDFSISSTGTNKDVVNEIKLVNEATKELSKITYDKGELTNKETQKTKEIRNSVLASLKKEQYDWKKTHNDGSTPFNIIMRPGMNKSVYIKRKKEIQFDLNNLILTDISFSGNFTIPRIPLSGYPIPTHQFMGGYSESLALTFVSANKSGENDLVSLIGWVETSKEIARKYKYLAAFDGIEIEHNYINLILDGYRYIVDNIVTQTNPEIPGCSQVVIHLTECSKMQADIDRQQLFYGEPQDSTIDGSYYDDIIKAFFDDIREKFSFQGYVDISGLASSSTAIDMSNRIVAGSDHQTSQGQHINTAVTGNKPISQDGISDIRAFLTYTANIAIEKQSELLSNLIKSVSIDLSNKANSSGKYNFYDASPDSYLYKYNYIVANTSLVKSGGKWTDKKDAIHGIYEQIRDWFVSNHFKIRQVFCGETADNIGVTANNEFPRLNDLITNKYNKDYFTNLGLINTPAYLDFDLPPTIGPSHYFYDNRDSEYAGTLTESLIGVKQIKDKDDATKAFGAFQSVATVESKDFDNKGKIETSAFHRKFKSYVDKIGSSAFDAAPGEIYKTTLGYGENSNMSDISDIGAYTKRTAYELDSDGKIKRDSNGKPIIKPSNQATYQTNTADGVSVNDVEKYTGHLALNNMAWDPMKIESTSNNRLIGTNISGSNVINTVGNVAKNAPTENNTPSAVFNDNPMYGAGLFTYNANNSSGSPLSPKHMFPVWKVYLIEEDEIETLTPFKSYRDLNDMFGLNSIIDIKYVDHGDQPADMLVATFVDMTGRVTSEKYESRAHQEKKYKFDQTLTEDGTKKAFAENPLKGLVIKQGTIIQFRAGYSNNVNELEVKFNGYVTSIDGENNIYTIMCQGFGVELVQSLKCTDAPKDICSFNAETREILYWALTHPELKHFGRWKLNSIANKQFSADQKGYYMTGAIGGGFRTFKADGSLSERYYEYVKTPADMNCLTPIESKWIGLENWKRSLICDVPGTLLTVGIDLLKFWKWFSAGANLFESFFTKYYVYNDTVWNIIDEMTFRYPGYIAKVMPFDTRSTLYYGPPEGMYYHRSLTSFEEATLAQNSDAISKLNKDLEHNIGKEKDMLSVLDNRYLNNAVDATVQRIKDKYKRRDEIVALGNRVNTTFWTKEDGVIVDKQWVRNYIQANLFESQQNKVFSEDEKVLLGLDNKSSIPYINSARNTYSKYNEYKAWVKSGTEKLHTLMTGKSTKPFINYHDFSSHCNIIKNNIKADCRDSYNKVTINYGSVGLTADQYTEAKTKGTSPGTTTMQLNAFLADEDLRETAVTFPNCQTEEDAIKYGAQFLSREAKKLYKGEVSLIGNPAIKPFDKAFITDVAEEMYGPIEVAQHILSISATDGMISNVTPSMISNIKNTVGMTVLDTLSYYRNNTKIRDFYKTNGSSADNPLIWDMVSTETNAANTASSLQLTGAIGAVAFGTLAFTILGPATLLAGLFMASAMADLGYTIGNNLRKFNPIMLRPLIKNGVPYILGNNSYQNGNLLMYHNHEYKLFTEDWNSMNDYIAAMYNNTTSNPYIDNPPK